MKLSEIEKINSRQLVIKEGKQQWIESELNIQFKLPSMKLLEEMNEKVFSQLKDTDTNLQFVYKALPVLTDIEIDKDEEWFGKQLDEENYGAVMIFKAVLNQAQENLDHVSEVIELAEQDIKLKEDALKITEKIKDKQAVIAGK